MKKHVFVFMLMLPLCVCAGSSYAQNGHSGDGHAADSGRFQYHISLGTGVLDGWGSTHAYTLVAPTFEYQLSPKVKAFGGFAVCNDVNATLYRWAPRTPSYLPRRNSSVAGAAAAGVLYQPNDRLTLAACAYYLGGQADPLWNAGRPVDLNAFGVSGAMNYRFGKNSSLSIFFDYVHDQAGTLVDPWMMYYGMGDSFFHDAWHHHHSPLSGLVPDYYFY